MATKEETLNKLVKAGYKRPSLNAAWDELREYICNLKAANGTNPRWNYWSYMKPQISRMKDQSDLPESVKNLRLRSNYWMFLAKAVYHDVVDVYQKTTKRKRPDNEDNSDIKERKEAKKSVDLNLLPHDTIFYWQIGDKIDTRTGIPACITVNDCLGGSSVHINDMTVAAFCARLRSRSGYEDLEPLQVYYFDLDNKNITIKVMNDVDFQHAITEMVLRSLSSRAANKPMFLFYIQDQDKSTENSPLIKKKIKPERDWFLSPDAK